MDAELEENLLGDMRDVMRWIHLIEKLKRRIQKQLEKFCCRLFCVLRKDLLVFWKTFVFGEKESAPRKMVHNWRADVCEMCLAVAIADVSWRVFCEKIKLWHVFGSRAMLGGVH